jgi:HK97 family phage portal protein
VKPGSIRGVSRTEALKENFGLAIALQNYSAKFFGQGTNTSGVLEVPGTLNADQAAQLQEAFDSRHRGWKNSHKTAVLSGGASYKPTSINPQDSQLLEARNHAVADVARAFSIPPHLLGLDQGMSYASVEQNNLAWVTHGLRPIVSKLESGFSKLIRMSPGAENAFIKWNLDGLLRADYNSRLAGYSTGLQSGFFSINDIRRFEDLAPVDDPSAETVRVPLQNVNVENATISSQSQKVKMATALVSVGYDPKSVLESLGLPDIEHSGLPSVQLQGVQNIDPEDPESVYDVED